MRIDRTHELRSMSMTSRRPITRRDVVEATVVTIAGLVGIAAVMVGLAVAGLGRYSWIVSMLLAPVAISALAWQRRRGASPGPTGTE